LMPTAISTFMTAVPKDPNSGATGATACSLLGGTTAGMYTYCQIDNSGTTSKFCYYTRLENKKTINAVDYYYYTASHAGNFYKTIQPASLDLCATQS